MKTTTAEKEDKRSELQAFAQIESIVEMVEALETAANNDDDSALDEARDAIQSDPLSVEVRGDWHNPGDKEQSAPTEYKILLCTGGPAVQIIGELDQWQQPSTAEVQHQDWFTPWISVRPRNDKEADALLKYAQEFYFGE